MLLEPIDQEEFRFRHSGWQKTRERILTAFRATRMDGRRVERFENCGSGAHVYRRKGADDVRVQANYCHDRFCLPCATARAHKIAGNLRRQMSGNTHRHLVLTVKSRSEPLADQIRRLYRCFKQLRRQKVWLRHVAGGAAFFECTWNAERRQWHPHLHCVLQGKYIPKEELAAAWLTVTGDSNILDLSWIDNTEAAVREVSKYASKPLDTSITTDPDALQEYVCSLRGVRLCLTFGCWRGFKLEANLDKYKPEDWVRVGRLSTILAEARAGSIGAQVLIARLAKGVVACAPIPPGPGP